MIDSDMRICFAMFAMLRMSWNRGEEERDAKDCWTIADEMLKAQNPEHEGGIAAIKKRQPKGKPDVPQ
jgi:hypothetical protein